jgi:hypothetical protein
MLNLFRSTGFAVFSNSTLLLSAASCVKKEDIVLISTGAISGTIAPAMAGTTITAAPATGTAITAVPNSDGSYLLSSLAPGAYSISCSPPAGYNVPATITSNVAAGETKTANFVLNQPGFQFYLDSYLKTASVIECTYQNNSLHIIGSASYGSPLPWGSVSFTLDNVTDPGSYVMRNGNESVSYSPASGSREYSITGGTVQITKLDVITHEVSGTLRWGDHFDNLIMK